jgi:DNA-binding HxlR family transcriptional regulator
MSDRSNYDETIVDYLEGKGAIEIAYQIVIDGASFSQLKNETGLSPATLSKRLKRGEELGLWTTIANRSGTGRSKQKYVPTQNGLQLLRLMVNIGFPRTYERYNVFEEEFRRSQKELLEEVSKKVDDGDLPPPWIEPPEPTAEALESIQNIDIEQTGVNPFDQPDTTESPSQPDIDTTDYSPAEIQALLRELLETHPDAIDLDELSRESDDDSDTTNDQ